MKIDKSEYLSSSFHLSQQQPYIDLFISVIIKCSRYLKLVSSHLSSDWEMEGKPMGYSGLQLASS